MEGGVHGLMELMKQPAIIETFVDILLCAVPIWLAVMIGLFIGWSWRPRWTGILFLGFRSKLRFIWTAPAPPGFGAHRLWLAFTALSAFSVLPTVWSSFRGRDKRSSQQVVDSSQHQSSSSHSDIHTTANSDGAFEAELTENDLKHLIHLLEGKNGEISWQSLMERTTSNMSYQAWVHEPENGPTMYRSRTVFEDASAELVRGFFWDDEFRPKWDRMLIYFKILDECSHTGTMIVHWIKKFPFFCSDREYIIGRRIWESGKAYYCITKGVPYPTLPKRDKPRRVECYFSSWMIKPAKSRKGDMTACEVTLVHYEDMGIPKDVAKLGVRHGMWGTVKKLHAGLRAYQNARKSGEALSRCALMANMSTKISSEVDRVPACSSSDEDPSQTSDSEACRKQGIDWKWVVVGGTVAVVFGLKSEVIRKAVMLGARRKILGG